MISIKQLIQNYQNSDSPDKIIDLQPIDLIASLDFVLAAYSFADLKKLCTAIHPTAKIINLSSNKLANMANFIEFFSLLPHGIKEINLANNQLDRLNVDKLIHALQFFPNLETLSLVNNNLGSVPTEDLVKLFKSLSSGLKVLDLGVNDLHLQGKNLEEVFAALPKDLISLKFYGENFQTLDDCILTEALQNLGKDLKYLSFHDLKIGDFKNFARVLAAIPNGVSYLYLNFDLPPSTCELAKTYSSLPPNIKTLNIQSNFFQKNFNDLQPLFASFPATITELNIGFNNLGDLSCDELIQLLQVLPKSITCLNLQHNGLDKYESTELARIFANFPQNITNIYLDWNFPNSSIDIDSKLEATLKAIPESVKLLSLKHCYFEKKNSEIIEAIFKAIPSSVTSLNICLLDLIKFLRTETVSDEYKIEPRLKNILTQIDTLYLNYTDINFFENKIPAGLMSIFPNVKKIIPTYCDIPITDPFYTNHFNRLFGLNISPPSLYQHALFFAKKNFNACNKKSLCPSIIKDLKEVQIFEADNPFYPF